MFGCLFWWPVVAFALGASRRPWVAATMLLLHAAAVVAMLVFGTPFESDTEQWRYDEQARLFFGALLFTGWVVYVVGQAIAGAMVLLRSVDGDRATA